MKDFEVIVLHHAEIEGLCQCDSESHKKVQH